MSSNEAAVSSSAVYAFDILMKLKEAGFSGLETVHGVGWRIVAEG